MEMPMGFFGRWEKNDAFHIVLCVIGKVLTSNFFSIISRISLLVILLVFVLFCTEAVQNSSLMGICLPKSQQLMTLGRTLGSSGHGAFPLFHRGQTSVPTMWWKMQKNNTSDRILELGTASFCWLPQDEKKKKKNLILRCICTFPIGFHELSA